FTRRLKELLGDTYAKLKGKIKEIYEAAKSDAGFLRLPQRKKRIQGAKERSKNQKRVTRYFTRALPKAALPVRDFLTGSQRRVKYEVELRAGEFRDALKAAYPKKPTEQDFQTINAVLNGKAPITAIPKAMRPSVTALRDTVDKWTNALIASGAVPQELIDKLRENLGEYLTRSFRIFDDVKYRDEVLGAISGVGQYSPDIANKVLAAVNYLTAEYTVPTVSDLNQMAWPDLLKLAAHRGVKFIGKKKAEVIAELDALPNKVPTDQEIRNQLSDLIRRAKDVNGNLEALTGRVEGQMDLRSMMRRKNIPEVLRDLMGEHKDPLVNFYRSVARISQQVARHRFMTDLVQAGLKNGFIFDHAPGKPMPDPFNPKYMTRFDQPMGGKNDPSTAPYNGYYTNAEIWQALERAVEAQVLSDGMRVYYTASGAIKLGMTAGSLPSTVRNFLANTHFAIMHGHMDPRKMHKAFLIAGAKWGNSAKFEELTGRLIERLVISSGASSQETREVLNDMAARTDDMQSFHAGLVDKIAAAAKKGVRFATDTYQLMDDVWKINGFLHEYDRYTKIGKKRGWTEEQIFDKAASIIVDTYPTYDVLPEINTVLRRHLSFVPFASFTNAVFRVHYKTAQLINEERKSDDTRHLAALRFAGTAAALLTTYTAGKMAREFFSGMDDEDEEAFRWLISPYDKLSNIIILSNPNKSGKLEYINGSYTFA
ncbi:MAG: hypothetical protein KC488_04195, partial [Candidatus Cloacimonetes bacterium]|nr:hypothetical protein [Candidatus Cloacimonadota bacterium]